MKRRRLWVRNSIWLLVWSALLLAAWQWRWLRDQYVLRTYTPTPAVMSLIDGIELSPAGRAALYRSQPSVDDKTLFAQHCPTESAGLELGCYDRGKIYVLQIDNAELAPEMKVVLVHEILHAVWEDLSAGERQKLTAEVLQYYQEKQSSSQDLRERMAGYAETEPGEEANELHSIFGSEAAVLPDALEAHYGRYVKNRPTVVDYHQQYAQVFQGRLAQLERELVAIQSDKVALDALNSRMESLRRSGKIAEYNALVPQQNRMVVAINARIEAYRLAVEDYNALSLVLDAQAAPELVRPVQ